MNTFGASCTARCAGATLLRAGVSAAPAGRPACPPTTSPPFPAAPAPPARDILAAWEAGVAQDPIDRALTLLRLAGPAGRCLVRGRRDGVVCAVGELPAETVAAWRQRLAEFDPQAEMRLALTCPGCSHAWVELFEIAACLWMEVSTEEHRLLREVDRIARTYGWSEAEILALGRTRREAYLEMIPA